MCPTLLLPPPPPPSGTAGITFALPCNPCCDLAPLTPTLLPCANPHPNTFPFVAFFLTGLVSLGGSSAPYCALLHSLPCALCAPALTPYLPPLLPLCVTPLFISFPTLFPAPFTLLHTHYLHTLPFCSYSSPMPSTPFLPPFFCLYSYLWFLFLVVGPFPLPYSPTLFPFWKDRFPSCHCVPCPSATLLLYFHWSTIVCSLPSY